MFKFHATGRTLETIEKELLVAKTVKDYEASFSFDDSWDGWAKRAVFGNVSSGIKKEMILESDGTCVIPWEVLETHGALLVGVYGVMNDKQKPTLWTDRLYIREGTEPGEPAKEPTPDVVAQIQESIDKAIISGAYIDEEENLIIETKNGDTYNAGPLPEGGGSGGGDGEDGKSAYEIAVENGFEGSEEEWLASLQGEDGHTPVKGVDYFTPDDIADLKIPVVDDFMSEESGNAIANKVITEYVRQVSEDVQGANTQIGLVATDVKGIQQQINQHAHFKGYFSTNAKIQATEATPNDFAYSAESGTKWVYDEVDGWVDTGTPVPDQMTPASDTPPLVDGEASVGTENAYARGDHRHPSDPSKASAAEHNKVKADVENLKVHINNNGDVEDLSQTIEHNKINYYGVVTRSINAVMSENPLLGFSSALYFSTPAVIPENYSAFPEPDEVYFTGDSTDEGFFVPEADMRYTIVFDYDGIGFNAYVRGVSR